MNPLSKILLAFLFVWLPSKALGQLFNFSSLFGGTKLSDMIPGMQKDKTESSTTVLNEWLAHMKGFDISQMFTFEIHSGDVITFYFEVAKVPQVLRGAYTVSAKSRNKVSFSITDPDKDTIFLKEGEREVIFYPNVTVAGKYALEFRNKNVTQTITLVLRDRGDNFWRGARLPEFAEVQCKSHAQHKSFRWVRSKVETCGDERERPVDAAEVLWQTQDKAERRLFEREGVDVMNIGWKSLYVTAVETLVVVALTVWEVYYIKKMLDFRQVV